MKKNLMILAMAAILFACNNSGETDSADKTDNKTETPAADDAATSSAPTLPAGITQEDYDKGLTLVAQSDCLTCHKINEKLTGPSYQDIANKYEVNDANITMLAGKVIKGGSGVWGTIPMTPHDGLSEEDAKTMVKYVLSLKTVK